MDASVRTEAARVAEWFSSPTDQVTAKTMQQAKDTTDKVKRIGV